MRSEGEVKRQHFAVKEEDVQLSVSELRLILHFSDTCSFFHVLQVHLRTECMPNESFKGSGAGLKISPAQIIQRKCSFQKNM